MAHQSKPKPCSGPSKKKIRRNQAFGGFRHTHLRTSHAAEICWRNVGVGLYSWPANHHGKLFPFHLFVVFPKAIPCSRDLLINKDFLVPWRCLREHGFQSCVSPWPTSSLCAFRKMSTRNAQAKFLNLHAEVQEFLKELRLARQEGRGFRQASHLGCSNLGV